ncbi:MAG: hypothetical protein U0X20_28455 [Caldilineaceae bacterium]
MDDYLRMNKEFVSLLPADYNGIASLDDLDVPFFSGALASVWTGTWKNKLYTSQIPFNYGVTYLPPFTTADAAGARTPPIAWAARRAAASTVSPSRRRTPVSSTWRSTSDVPVGPAEL